MVFIESSNFTKSIDDYLADECYRELQLSLILNPGAGKVMPGCGGLRKIRFADPRRGKGKRGGLRIIYLFIPEQDWIFLLDIYGKGEKDDLTGEEKKVLARLATRIKEAAKGKRKGW
ncbi:MAG: type II toxin-antitoxin system RelE/ParE family toxin [Deltaproteobacteria bacterium]|nr:type II toxin-antitoxin system RelE/ParE family toxin [Deltaproteobacteria bacterium]